MSLLCQDFVGFLIVINIDFDFCRKIGCDRYAPASNMLGFHLTESCDVVTDWNAQHVYSNQDGDTFVDDEEIISWDQVPKDCPFLLENLVGRDHKESS